MCIFNLISLLIFYITLNSCYTQGNFINEKQQFSAKELPFSSFISLSSEIEYNLSQNGTKHIAKNIAVASGFIGKISLKTKKLYILTANHFCNHRNEMKNKQLSQSFFGEDFFGRKHRLFYLFSANKIADICVLVAEIYDSELQQVELSTIKPKIGEKVFNIAAPGALHGKEMVLVFNGLYSGYSENREWFTVPVTKGSSGSPVFNDEGKLISVIHSFPIEEHTRIIETIGLGTTFEELKPIFDSIDSIDLIINDLIETSTSTSTST